MSVSVHILASALVVKKNFSTRAWHRRKRLPELALDEKLIHEILKYESIHTSKSTGNIRVSYMV